MFSLKKKKVWLFPLGGQKNITFTHVEIICKTDTHRPFYTQVDIYGFEILVKYGRFIYLYKLGLSDPICTSFCGFHM